MMKPTFLITLAAFACATLSFAARAPLSERELLAEATHVVGGMVLKVGSAVAKSTVETAFGDHRDTTFTITLLITDITKGDGIKADEPMEFTAWKPERRIPPLPGLQGNEEIPIKGNHVTAYLIKDGDTYKAVLPNGITIHRAG